MKKIIVAFERFIEGHGLSLFLTLVTGTIIILIAIVSWFWPNIYKFVRETHAFEAIVILMLIEIVVLLTKERGTTEEFVVFKEESDVQVKIFEIIKQISIKRARFISAGIGSRTLLIGRLLRAGINVQVLAQDPETAIDKRDAQRTYASIDWIKLDVDTEILSKLDICFHTNICSLRALVLSEEHSNVKHIFTGWYTYYDKNTKIHGSQNPTIYFTTRSHHGRILCEWVETMIEENEKGSRPVTSEH